MSDEISLDFYERFLEANGSLGKSDLEFLLANSAKYTTDPEEPIRGLGDDIEGIIDRLRTLQKKTSEEVCRRYCRSSAIQKDLLRASTRARELMVVANLIIKIIPELGDSWISHVNAEFASILALLAFGEKINEFMKTRCPCKDGGMKN